ncbi:aquaporin [Candidatus Saccharibacteria bacterium]|nr:aquaporin [Candidatus Saccharibacteria bacterium]
MTAIYERLGIGMASPKEKPLGVIVVCEAMGSFLFGLSGIYAATEAYLGNADTLTVLSAFGFMLLLMVCLFAGGSGAHLNWMVSVAMTYLGEVSLRQLPVYILAQSVGFATAVYTLQLAYGPSGKEVLGASAPQLADGIGLLAGMFWEGLGGMVLMLGILAALYVPRLEPIAPLVIGLAVMAGIWVASRWTGGGINPPRALAHFLAGGQWPSPDAALLVYVVGPVIGGLLGVVIFMQVARKS